MNRIKQRQREVMDETAKLILEARTNWMDAWMKRLMPSEIYELAQDASNADRRALRAWMVKEKIKLKQWPDRTELWIGEKILGQFSVEFDTAEGKMNFLSKDFTEPDQDGQERTAL